MKFEKIVTDYGYIEGYKLTGSDITIIKTARRVKTTNVGFSTLERYAWETGWQVNYQVNGVKYGRYFHLLKDAKYFATAEYMNI